MGLFLHGTSEESVSFEDSRKQPIIEPNVVELNGIMPNHSWFGD